MAILRLLPYQQISKDILFNLRDEIQSRLPDRLFQEVTASPDRLDLPEDSFVKTRNQYRADDFIRNMVRHMPEDGRAIGIVDEDVFSAKEDYVLGLAERGRNALVPLPRLREEFYGREPDNSLFRTRALKVALHELGQAMKLDHCGDECVMQRFKTVEDLDSIPPTFCEDCTEELQDRYLSQIGDKR
ncbi:hypothetical protein EU546_05655 [Candidatus Thorarchaeota archaeon]|nr:MAG: hypothetical protein EU546_05655 [Candidatus Thorarchaeota archaeon]